MLRPPTCQQQPMNVESAHLPLGTQHTLIPADRGEALWKREEVHGVHCDPADTMELSQSFRKKLSNLTQFFQEMESDVATMQNDMKNDMSSSR